MTRLPNPVNGAANETVPSWTTATARRSGDAISIPFRLIAVPNFDEAVAVYTQKMGFREAFTVRNDQGQPQLAYVQVSRNTFIELQAANATRPPGLNHLGLHVENLRAVVDAMKQRGVKVEEPRVRPDDASVASELILPECVTQNGHRCIVIAGLR